MSANNIIRLNVDNSNQGSSEKPLEFNLINTTTFVDNSIDYEVYIEKCEIPISRGLPIYRSRTPLKLVIEATDKADAPAIFPYGEAFLEYDLGSSFTNVRELVSVINEKIYNQIDTAHQWCYFSVDNSKLSFNVTKHAAASKMKIWLDSSLEGLLEGLPCGGFGYIQGYEYIEIVSPKPADLTYSQEESMVKNFVNLKTFRLYSTLPTEAYWLYDQVLGTMVQSNLLGEVIFNSKEMVDNENLLYIPNVFRYSSMTDAGSITKFSLRVVAYYFSGLEEPCTLDKNSYASITLVFERKNKI